MPRPGKRSTRRIERKSGALEVDASPLDQGSGQLGKQWQLRLVGAGKVPQRNWLGQKSVNEVDGTWLVGWLVA